MYFMLHAIFVDVGLLEWVFVPFSVVQIVCVVARVLEWAVALAFVEVAAWNFFKSLRVLLDELLLLRAPAHHLGGWNDQITVFSTNRASSEMSLLDFLVVSCTPVSNAVKAEAMRAAFKNTESLSVC